MLNKIQKAGVAGAGAMGLGIAQVFAQSNFEVVLYDVSNEQLNLAKQTIEANLSGAVTKGKLSEQQKNETLNRITYTTDVNALVADVVVEAIVEKLEIKKQLFEKLAAINGEETILASNTSSIPITRIAKEIPHPERVAGMHFFNPAHIMKLVEVISGVETSETVALTLKDLSIKLGKTPVMCKDSPGFIVNRVARHYYVESLKLLEEKAATMENIDALMESAGFKLGPFKLMDLVGNDINFAVTSSLYESFHQEAKFRPSRIQQQKVEAGHLGKKTGKGFYTYPSKT
ncbi:MAG: 3-hydroxybutyryl-CoA dehydrogenase [Chitinophagales bacterium]|nr:3-hydroxybutyryl-CoA dehydrogenase [Chitinophagales bacterium]